VRETILDGMIGALRAAMAFDPNVQEEPVALLWPDEGAQWQQVVDRIAERLPVVSLGSYDPENHRGPAYWIRCVVAGTIDMGLPEGTPIVYLPGVRRSAIRASDNCPPELAPIAELQYRSQWFSHPNSRDWTVRALLSNGERGLGLRLADDARTKDALQVALKRLMDERVDRLETQSVDANFLHDLVNPDPVLSLLNWLDDPVGFRAQSDDEEWTAFVQQCRIDFEFDPMADGEISAARELGSRRARWKGAWKRFAETPERFPGVVGQLRKARPEELVVNQDVWPQDNEIAEDQLRNRLRDFEALTAAGAQEEISRLEAEHEWRRGTVWADLDQAPLAFALEQLSALGDVTKQPLASSDLDSLVSDYAERGWRADDAVLRSLAAVPLDADREAVSAAANSLYRDWVDSGAKVLQTIISSLASTHGYRTEPPRSIAPGTVIVFVDGLRLDISHRVQDWLSGAGLIVTASTSLSALPTVTQTAKAALVPVADGVLGPGSDLHAANASTGTEASVQVLRSLMAENGVQALGPGEAGDSSGTAFTEVGEIDRRGHDEGVRLVDQIDDEVGRIVRRIRELLSAGWERIEVVTDHGWILLPGGMEKVGLPAATAVLKKGRCARLKDGAAVEVPTVPWYWDSEVRIALAPGASCFEASKEYEHGGVSPQECIVPRLTVTAGAAPSGGPEFTRVKWLGLQCRVEFSGVTDKVTVDLRGLPGEPKSSIAEQAKETSSAGKVSLLVPDEENEGEPAHLVLVAPDGQVLAQRDVVVGRNR
jgi:hypothetical protein